MRAETNYKKKENLQLATLHHVCNDKQKSVATKSQKNYSFIEYTPHFLCDITLHVFPPVGAWVIVWVSLKKRIYESAWGKSWNSLLNLCLHPSSLVKHHPPTYWHLHMVGIDCQGHCVCLAAQMKGQVSRHYPGMCCIWGSVTMNHCCPWCSVCWKVEVVHSWVCMCMQDRRVWDANLVSAAYTWWLMFAQITR